MNGLDGIDFNCYFVKVGALTLLAVLLCSCATRKPAISDGEREFLKKYPTVREGGKAYKVIPNEDILMREEVAVPPAPDDSTSSIHINLAKKRAWLYKNGFLAHTSPVCTGKSGFETPTGVFRVISKHEDWVSTLYHVPMPFFLRLNADDGKVGLHAGAIALEPASHGCIRLPRKMAEAFFRESPVGTKVVVVAGDEGEFL